MSTELELLSGAERMLAQAVTVQDFADIVDQAELARAFAKKAGLSRASINHATAIRLQAERGLADAVDAGQRAGVIAEKGRPGKSSGSEDFPVATLREVGVRNSRILHEARKLRDGFTPDEIVALTEDANAKDKLLSRDRLVKEAAAKKIEANKGEGVAPQPPKGKFSTILADPPWHYGNGGTRAAARGHYRTMTIDELCELDVAPSSAAENAHLYMWTTAGHLPDAFRVMEAWGFSYKTFLVWIKPQMGMGNYFRVSSELVLFGIRGELPIVDRSIRNWFEAKRGKHSAKPEGFYQLVHRASPGPYLEMFARCRRGNQLICGCARCQHGWDVWGDEA